MPEAVHRPRTLPDAHQHHDLNDTGSRRLTYIEASPRATPAKCRRRRSPPAIDDSPAAGTTCPPTRPGPPRAAVYFQPEHVRSADPGPGPRIPGPQPPDTTPGHHAGRPPATQPTDADPKPQQSPDTTTHPQAPEKSPPVPPRATPHPAPDPPSPPTISSTTTDATRPPTHWRTHRMTASILYLRVPAPEDGARRSVFEVPRVSRTVDTIPPLR